MSVRTDLIVLLTGCAMACSPAGGPSDVLESGSSEFPKGGAETRVDPNPASAAKRRRAFPNAWNMTCTPRELGPDDTLILRFAGAHGPEAEVISPDGHVYFLAGPDEPSLLPMPLDGDVLLPVREAVGFNGPKRWPIFVESGVYTFIFGANLAVDLEDTDYNAYCNVVYRSGR